MSVDMGQAKVVGSEPEWVEGDVLDATASTSATRTSCCGGVP